MKTLYAQTLFVVAIIVLVSSTGHPMSAIAMSLLFVPLLAMKWFFGRK